MLGGYDLTEAKMKPDDRDITMRAEQSARLENAATERARYDAIRARARRAEWLEEMAGRARVFRDDQR